MTFPIVKRTNIALLFVARETPPLPTDVRCEHCGIFTFSPVCVDCWSARYGLFAESLD